MVSVSRETPLGEVARVLSDQDIGGVPVLDEQRRPVGIVTDSDFAGPERCVPFSFPARKRPAVFGEWAHGQRFEELCERARRMPARAVISTPVVTATEDEPVEAVEEWILRFHVNRIPIVRDGELVGMVARHDLLKLMLGAQARLEVRS